MKKSDDGYFVVNKEKRRKDQQVLRRINIGFTEEQLDIMQQYADVHGYSKMRVLKLKVIQKGIEELRNELQRKPADFR